MDGFFAAAFWAAYPSPGEAPPAAPLGGVGVGALDSAFATAFSALDARTAMRLDGAGAPFLTFACEITTEGRGPNVVQPHAAAVCRALACASACPKARRRIPMRPLFKEGAPPDPTDYRPIAVTTVMYRLYAGMCARVVQQWAVGRTDPLIPPEQFGFHPGRSTAQAAFVLQHMVHAGQHSSVRAAGGKLFVPFVLLLSRPMIGWTGGACGRPCGTPTCLSGC